MINDISHRPWPMPDSPWIMVQKWHDLLFMHWPLPIASLMPFIPKGLALDTFDGKAWIGIVPFHMSGIRMRWLPEIPGTSAFPELNVRTYVTDGKKPGVWFFSLDATNLLAVHAARMSYCLPYFHADMSIRNVGGTFHYKSQRKQYATVQPELLMEYAPVGDRYIATKGSLDHWLTERYCLYAERAGNIYRAEIHHGPWQLQPAKAKISTNAMAHFLQHSLPDTEPLLHFSSLQEVFVWGPEKIGKMGKDSRDRRRNQK